MTQTMKRWEMDGIGRDTLELREAPIPTAGPGEVLVKVAAASLNYRDKLVIEGGMPLPLTFPFTPGSDLAGTVVALGQGTARFDEGDSVISSFAPGWIEGSPLGDARTPPYRTLGGTHPGVLAEYVAFPEDWVVRAPATISDAEATTLPCAGLTAWFGLVDKGKLHAGETVLIEGTGGVALFGLQIARRMGRRRSWSRAVPRSWTGPDRSAPTMASTARRKTGWKPSSASPATAARTTSSNLSAGRILAKQFRLPRSMEISTRSA